MAPERYELLPRGNGRRNLKKYRETPKCAVPYCLSPAASARICYQFLCDTHWSGISEAHEEQAWEFHEQWADGTLDVGGYAAFKEMVAKDADATRHANNRQIAGSGGKNIGVACEDQR